MVLKIDFDNANQKKLLQHIKWLIEIGLVDSYQIEIPKVNREGEITTSFIKKMIEEGETDFKNGDVYTQEEVDQKLKEWQEQKR